MFRRLFQKKQSNEQLIRALYGEIVAQARQATFYRDFGAPDTLDGRFNMIVLHCFILFHRLKNETGGEREISQAVFDMFRLDMDRSLREIGVGDTTVPKRMKKMMQVFYGRTQAYDKAADLSEPEAAMADALRRNILSYNDSLFEGEGDDSPDRDSKMADEKAKALSQYVLAAISHVEKQSTKDISGGSVSFPDPQSYIATT
ncbi:MAG: ubiquinol-cytochrome C chaperone [Rhizobiales bacterium]|nr:ubiquinol-cytochrome C chaperone [Hyphomicrobiales bacterium]